MRFNLNQVIIDVPTVALYNQSILNCVMRQCSPFEELRTEILESK